MHIEFKIRAKYINNPVESKSSDFSIFYFILGVLIVTFWILFFFFIVKNIKSKTISCDTYIYIFIEEYYYYYY